ncbi:hydroxyethylthiazole kinase [Acetohalobium arabaticum]|uniref:Hydroxyethylthiazole kinase n=1 Tax=Acetohalobium arabaticum (strain ATCC 49924 / DSM 5501 / Z-7288) TaxID=574087 RepID=D9QT36_ACEAZ|nr:hydroxyethylthiazole kinase [Acetohalobium arabaticum]ADL13536.1 hydroxyethylthiazole kinase [Acetohalobium arabaticum DSM 5501]
MQETLSRIREEKPLVHQITNYVTVNDAANITLYWGGLPVMADAKEEVAEMVQAAQALVLNIGTLNQRQVSSMIKAGKQANRSGIPVILDPVGVGATTFRTETARRILDELQVAVIKGNQGEISILAEGQGEVRGVESVGDYEELVANAQGLAAAEEAVVVVSGTKDIVTDGETVYKVNNGHPLLGEIVGTGCMLGSTLGVFTGVSDDYLAASLTAVTAYGIAGEIASKKASKPASYKTAFMDSISELTDETVINHEEITKL